MFNNYHVILASNRLSKKQIKTSCECTVAMTDDDEANIYKIILYSIYFLYALELLQ